MAITEVDMKKVVLEAATLISSTTAAEMTTNEDAQEKANIQNVFRLVFIGIKEGMVREIMNRAGRNITNPVLRLANGVSLKKSEQTPSAPAH